MRKTMLGLDPTRRRTLRPILRCKSHSSTRVFQKCCNVQLIMKSSLVVQERDCRPQFYIAIGCWEKWKRRTCNGDHQSPDEEHAWWFHVIEAHLHKEIEKWFERKRLVGAQDSCWSSRSHQILMDSKELHCIERVKAANCSTMLKSEEGYLIW